MATSKALRAFLLTDQAWKTILESTVLYLWGILMKEQPDLASVLHCGKWQGREVLLNCKGQQLPERCPLLLPHLQEEGVLVTTSGAIPQHSRGI